MSDYPLVYSYPRSGTHWFCSLLKEWFWPDDDSLAERITRVPHASWRGSEQSDEAIELGLIDVPWILLFGGHYYEPESIIEPGVGKPIYLWRDGRDVMVSVWKLDQTIAVGNGVPETPFSDYLRNHLHDPREFVETNPAPPVDEPFPTPLLWWWSTMSWRRRSDVLVVTYETLMKRRADVRRKVADYLGIDTTKTPTDKIDMTRARAEQPIGIAPSDFPRSGRWREHFTPADEAFWDEMRCKATKLLRRS